MCIMFENIKKYSIFIMVLGFLTWSFSPLTVLSKTTVNLNDQVMNTKRCSKCGEIKSISEFNVDNKSNDNLSYFCRKCNSEKNKLYNRSKIGLIAQIYRHQKANSKRRNHDAPNYTKQELYDYAISKPNFEELYNNWVKSDYSKNLAPSFDRLNDYKPYTLKNIQLVTWRENSLKGSSDRKNGINNKISRSVIQLDLNNNYINEYFSIKEAERQTLVFSAQIRSVCNNITISAKGFKWMFKEDYERRTV